ncbi:MAG: hypothetical protein N2517_04210 [Ignavibacteria bacterium]|nr:hypothetical protein [Ignavibacteria bacterium]
MSIFFSLLTACQGGISPDDGAAESIVVGRIIVVSGKASWPPPDSSRELRVLVVPQYPPINIFADILQGKAYLSDTLVRYTDTIPFRVVVQKPPMNSAFILASLRYGNISQQRLIGFYKKNRESKLPDMLKIDKGQILKGLDIFVDFNNLPEQKPQ